MAEINLPRLTEIENGDLKKIKIYLSKLQDELKYTLTNIDEDNMSASAADALSSALTAKTIAEDVYSGLNLKSGKTEASGGFISIGGISIAYGTLPCTFSESFIALGKATSPLNIRSGASTAYPKIGLISQYDTFNIISVSGDWANISYNGITGYASTRYMSITYKSSDSATFTATVPLPVIFPDGYAVNLTLEGADCEGITAFVTEKNTASFKAKLKKTQTGAVSVTLCYTAVGLRA